MKMFLKLLLTLLLPTADSLMVTMQVSFCSLALFILDDVFFSFNVFSRMEASQTIQASSNGETVSSSLSSLSASASGQSNFKHQIKHQMNLICTSANIFTLLTLQIISNNDTGFDSMRSGGCGIGCSATVFLQTTTSSTYVRVSAQLVKAFTTGVNSDLPTLPSF